MTKGREVNEGGDSAGDVKEEEGIVTAMTDVKDG